MVAARNSRRSRRSPVCAACTANAIVRLLVIRTAVFTPPSAMLSSWLPAAKAPGYQLRYTQ